MTSGPVRRYVRLLQIQVRTSLLTAMQYRWDFLAQGVMQCLWLILSALPLYVAYAARAAASGTALGGTDIGGWGFYPAMLVFGFFYLLKAVLEGAIHPALVAVIDHIRKGTLDFVLLKPADAQFLVSTARFELWHVIDGAASIGIIAYAAAHAGHGERPGVAAILAAALLFTCGALILYSVWLLVICAAFYVVKIDNLSFLLMGLFDFARWPRSVFRGALHVLFTYVIPLSVMTSVPADALLGRLGAGEAAWAVLATAVLLLGSRLLWRRSLSRYTSASS